MSNSQFLTPAKAARGLGSAKSGTHHHIGQRVSAIALVFLVPWFLFLSVSHCEKRLPGRFPREATRGHAAQVQRAAHICYATVATPTSF